MRSLLLLYIVISLLSFLSFLSCKNIIISDDTNIAENDSDIVSDDIDITIVNNNDKDNNGKDNTIFFLDDNSIDLLNDCIDKKIKDYNRYSNVCKDLKDTITSKTFGNYNNNIMQLHTFKKCEKICFYGELDLSNLFINSYRLWNYKITLDTDNNYIFNADTNNLLISLNEIFNLIKSKDISDEFNSLTSIIDINDEIITLRSLTINIIPHSIVFKGTLSIDNIEHNINIFIDPIQGTLAIKFEIDGYLINKSKFQKTILSSNSYHFNWLKFTKNAIISISNNEVDLPGQIEVFDDSYGFSKGSSIKVETTIYPKTNYGILNLLRDDSNSATFSTNIRLSNDEISSKSKLPDLKLTPSIKLHLICLFNKINRNDETEKMELHGTMTLKLPSSSDARFFFNSKLSSGSEKLHFEIEVKSKWSSPFGIQNSFIKSGSGFLNFDKLTPLTLELNADIIFGVSSPINGKAKVSLDFNKPKTDSLQISIPNSPIAHLINFFFGSKWKLPIFLKNKKFAITTALYTDSSISKRTDMGTLSGKGKFLGGDATMSITSNNGKGLSLHVHSSPYLFNGVKITESLGSKNAPHIKLVLLEDKLQTFKTSAYIDGPHYKGEVTLVMSDSGLSFNLTSYIHGLASTFAATITEDSIKFNGVVDDIQLTRQLYQYLGRNIDSFLETDFKKVEHSINDFVRQYLSGMKIQMSGDLASKVPKFHFKVYVYKHNIEFDADLSDMDNFFQEISTHFDDDVAAWIKTHNKK